MPFAASKGKYNWSHNKIDYLLSGNSLRRLACGSSHSRGHRCPAQKQLRSGGPASCVFPMVHRSATSAISLFPMAPPASNIFQIALRHGAPASNKPHPAEKSTPVWLAIWRIWAGFANSQLRCAAFHSTYHHICAHPYCCYLGSVAQTDANLSAHLHRLPTPPPYLRRMRLSHGQGAGVWCWMRLLPAKGADVGWQMLLLPAQGAGIGWQMMMLPGLVRRSCKSPSTLGAATRTSVKG